MNIDDRDYIDKELSEKFIIAQNKFNSFNNNDITNMILKAQKAKRKKFYSLYTLAACACFILIFCIGLFLNGKIDENVNVTADNTTINEEDIYINEYSMLFSSTVDISDINQLKELANDIVIAKVTRIDGGINYNKALKMYSSVNTIGEIEIIESIKGELKKNQVVPFIRLGGIIETSEYVKGLNEKRKRLIYEAEERGEETMLDYKYIKDIRVGDIEIEEGNIYLMFINYDPYNERYEIFGDQYGLREYDINTKMVLNNDTGEYETIESLNLY